MGGEIINSATITTYEAQRMDTRMPGYIERLLIEKGFEGTNHKLSTPTLYGELTTWHDRVTGTYHYTQTLSE